MPAARPVAVKLDPEIHDRMRKLAQAQNRSTHFLMREAIAQYVNREEQREAFRQEALDSWHDFQAHGLHLTQAEVEAWMTRLEAGEDAEPPECHD